MKNALLAIPSYNWFGDVRRILRLDQIADGALGTFVFAAINAYNLARFACSVAAAAVACHSCCATLIIRPSAPRNGTLL